MNGDDTPHIRCRACCNPLARGETQWTCRVCGAEYPAVLGIPDLRGENEPSNDDQVRRLVEAYPHCDLSDLVALRAPNFSTDDPALRELYSNYRKNLAERGRLYYAMVKRRMRELGFQARPGVALEIGCGVGSCTMQVATDFRHVIALDPSLPDLILAHKMLASAGVRNVTLLQGYAQNIPLEDDTADLAISENVLEHVIEVDETLSAVARVLKPGGCFVGDSANRYNLFRPEPHVKLWFVGFLPRSIQSGYVRRRRGFEGYGKSVRLLSYGELIRGLRRHFGEESRVVFPEASAYGFPRRFDPVFKMLDRIPGIAQLLLWVFPVHLAVARR